MCIAGGVLMPDPVSVSDPGAVVKGYAELFEKRGGRFEHADARTLEQGQRRLGSSARRAVRSLPRDVVVALGPWSDDVFRPLGYRFPLGIKRGYHQHFRALGQCHAQPAGARRRGRIHARRRCRAASASRPARSSPGATHRRRRCSLRASRRGRARSFRWASKAEPQFWLGRRPCLPDMLPIIGPAPRHRGLWFDFGHHHLGFTLGPVAGRLLAEMMTGEAPFTDPSPYRAERF